jgi:hypothetical protein
VQSPRGTPARRAQAQRDGDSETKVEKGKQKADGEPKPGEALTPSLADGYQGARDATILESYAASITTPEQLANGIVIVQCTERTKDLLRRAGYRRTTTHNDYAVHVVKDWLGRLQIAPPPRAEDEVAVKTLAAKMDGRRQRLSRTVVAKRMKAMGYTIFRSPTNIALRWLIRYVGGYWHKGGAHVARNNFGPGICFPKWRNDQDRQLVAEAINLSAGGAQ